ncbi:MAG: hypothetical protein HKN04_00690 [Rhodothermaceae bacterium]|nr:hypothetical protein [Rhodothermaceae bacterium]
MAERILLVNRFFGGAQTPTGRMLEDVARRLVEAGHHVEVLTSAAAYAGADGAAEVPVARVRTVWTPKQGRLGPWVAFLMQAALRIPFLPWDRCVLLTDPPMLLTAALGMRKRNRRLYWWTMDLYPEALASHGMLKEDGLAYRMLARLNTAALRRLDGVVTLGACQTERLDAYPTWSAVEAHVEVPPWDYRPLLRVERSANRLLNAQGWQDRRVVLYAGNIGEAHSFEEALGAARLLAADPASRWMFAFVVRGAQRDALEAAAADLPNVVVLDYLPPEQTADLLWSADVHLITMRPGWEGIVVPSKLYGVLMTDAPVLFIGPPEADTAREIRRLGRGTVLPADAPAEDVREAIEWLGATEASSGQRPDRTAPETIAAFVTA